MTFSIEEKSDYEVAIKKLLENRAERAKSNGVDLGYRFKRHSIEIFECHPSELHEAGYFEFKVAKVTFVKTKQHWNIYRITGNLKWVSYRRCPGVVALNDALTVIEQDEDRLFWGVAC
ncbi:hypothetical protein BOO25_21365 [Vibrio navarrensis]|uniref:DUF3024 domain-containing protein n=1 Tax=Vibrio navarrensis TaxID=29495 RepID=UPI00192FAC0A|nr:DUF3024 domain-containing protein [Vibrio navarrensis]MBE3671465.1 hypothetical protein [Vibrio navarrensis]